jgi:dihydroorotase-like cyclic amidohydrolase
MGLTVAEMTDLRGRLRTEGARIQVVKNTLAQKALGGSIGIRPLGLETLLPALMALHHDGRAPLLDLIRSVTLAPAQILGLDAGRLAPGAPADLTLCDLNAPIIVDADRLISKSKNSAFDGRRLQGQVLMTLVDGRVVHRLEQ